MPDYTYSEAIVMVQETGALAIGAVGVLRPDGGGDPVPIWDMNGSPVADVRVGPLGVHEPFKADIKRGELDFGSVVLPKVSDEMFDDLETAVVTAQEARTLAQEATIAADLATAAVERALGTGDVTEEYVTVSQLLSMRAEIDADIAESARIVFADSPDTPRPVTEPGKRLLWVPATNVEPINMAPQDRWVTGTVPTFDPEVSAPVNLRITGTGTTRTLSVDPVANATAYLFYDDGTLLGSPATNTLDHTFAAGSHSITVTVTVGGVTSPATPPETFTIASIDPAAYRAGAAMNNGQVAATTATTVTIPATAVAGDVAVLVAATNGASSFTTPAGWTVLSGPDINSGGGWRSIVYAKEITAADIGAAVTVAISAAGRLVGGVAVVQNTEIDLLVDSVAIYGGATGHVAPIVSIGSAGAAYLSVWIGRIGSTPAPTITLPAGLTAGPTAATTMGASPEFRVAFGYDDTANVAGSFGGGTATFSTAATANVYTFLLPIAAPSDEFAALSAPAFLDSSVTDQQVTLTWSAVAGANQYEVWEAGTVGEPVAVVTSTTRTTGLLAAGDYDYWVVAVDTSTGRRSGESPHELVTVTAGTGTDPDPTAPTGLRYTVSAGRDVDLLCDPVAGATAYRWHNKTAGSTAETATNSRDEGILPAGTYSFTVSAIVGGVETSESGSVTVIVSSTGTPSEPGVLPAIPPLAAGFKEIRLTSSSPAPTLDRYTDYRILCPDLIRANVDVHGGRNVQLIGGANVGTGERSFWVANFYGMAWIEGWHIQAPAGDPAALHEGFNISSNVGGSWMLLNSKTDKLHGSEPSFHSDIIQCWAMMPNTKGTVERVHGITQYQGAMLQPDNFGDGAGVTFYQRHVIYEHSADHNGGLLVLEGNTATKFAVVNEDVQFVQPEGGAMKYWIQPPGGGVQNVPGVRVVLPGKQTPVLVGNPGVGYVRA